MARHKNWKSRFSWGVRANTKTQLGRVFERLERREVLSVNWADTFGSTGNDSAYDLGVGPEGSVYVAGEFGSGTTIDFDDQNAGGEITSQASDGHPSPGTDGFLVKYDASGDFEWVLHAGTAGSSYVQVSGIDVDSQGNVYFVGWFSRSFNLYRDGSVLTSIATDNRAGEDIFVGMISANGELQWTQTLGGRGNERSSDLYLIEDDATGTVDFLLRGSTLNGGDLDPGPGDTLPNATRGDRHGFLARYSFDETETLALEWFAARETDSIVWINQLTITDGEVTGVGGLASDAGYVGVFDITTGAVLEEVFPDMGITGGTFYSVARAGDMIVVGGTLYSNDYDGDGVLDEGVDLDGDGRLDQGIASGYRYDPSRPQGERLEQTWDKGLQNSGFGELKATATGILGVGRISGSLSVDSTTLQAVGTGDGLLLELDPTSGVVTAADRWGGSGYETARKFEVNETTGAMYVIGTTTSPDATFPYVADTFSTEGGRDGYISVFTPITSAPPIADAGPAQFGDEDQAITFDASGSSDPDDDPLTFRWDFGDGETDETTEPTIMHTYASGGVFDVTLTVLDGTGNAATDTTTATVTEINDAPVADPGGPYSGVAAQGLSFDGSASSDVDDDPLTLSYLWEFGDGGTATIATPDYTYTAPGTYIVSLTVSDGVATSTASTTAVIEAAPSGDPSTIYVWNIEDLFETRQRGRNTDYRIVLDVFQDSDGDGVAELSDGGIAAVQVTIVLRDKHGVETTLTGQTDAEGRFRSDWMKNLEPGDYTAQVTDLALEGFNWLDGIMDVEDEQLLVI